MPNLRHPRSPNGFRRCVLCGKLAKREQVILTKHAQAAGTICTPCYNTNRLSRKFNNSRGFKIAPSRG